MNILSQKDPRWGSLKIGNTNYIMSGYGCFITACSIVAGIEPPEALQKLRFDGAMLIWDSIKNIGLEPLFKGDWDNAKALEYIQANGQCIARVDFDGSDRTDDTHFVVLIGNKQLIDPIDGKIKPTSTYSKYTGIRACRKIVMATMYKGLDLTNQESMKVAVDIWDEVINKKLYVKLSDIQERFGVPDLDGLATKLSGKDSRITDLTNQLGTAQAEVKNKEEIISRRDAELLTAHADVKALLDRVEEAAKTIERLGKDKGNLAIEVEQLKIQVETLKAAQTQGELTITLKELFLLLWNQKITIKKG